MDGAPAGRFAPLEDNVFGWVFTVLVFIAPWSAFATQDDCPTELASRQNEQFFAAFQESFLNPAIRDTYREAYIRSGVMLLTTSAINRRSDFILRTRRPKADVIVRANSVSIHTVSEGTFFLTLHSTPDVKAPLITITQDRSQEVPRAFSTLAFAGPELTHARSLDMYQVRALALLGKILIQAIEINGEISRIKSIQMSHRLSRNESDQTKYYLAALNRFAERSQLLPKIKKISEVLLLGGGPLGRQYQVDFVTRTDNSSDLVIVDADQRVSYEIALNPLEKNRLDINIYSLETGAFETVIYDRRGFHSVPNMTNSFAKFVGSVTALYEKINGASPVIFTRLEYNLLDPRERRSRGLHSDSVGLKNVRWNPPQR